MSGIRILLSSKNVWVIYFVIATLLVCITAINSTGYHHADEHYQIIEFANYFLGNVPASELPWEFEARIRPSVQPMVAVGFISALEFIGMSDPFEVLTMLRICTGLLGLWVFYRFYRFCIKGSVPTSLNNQLILIASTVVWFLPYLLVRFSSENLSSLMVMLGLSYLFEKERKGSLLLVGFIFGLSIAFRFQMAICVVGVQAWLMLVDKIGGKAFAKVLVGSCIGLVVLLISDFVFYGEFVFSPWNYFESNLIEGKAASFGIDPWWTYFMELWINLTPVVALLVASGAVVLLFKNKKHVIFWIALPFLIIHCFIGHKEYRFLFPIAFCVPWLLIELFTRLEKLKSRVFTLGFITLFIAFNLAGAMLMTQRKAGTGLVSLLEELHSNYVGGRIELVHFGYCNPYEPWEGGNHAHWYYKSRPNIITNKVETFNELKRRNNQGTEPRFLIVRQMDFNYHDIGLDDFTAENSLVASSYDPFLLELGVWFNMVDPQEVYYLFRLKS